MLSYRGAARVGLVLVVLVAMGVGVAALAGTDAPKATGQAVVANAVPSSPCQVVAAELTGSTRIYKGACPVKIKFTGAIKAAGSISANKPCTVKYIFTRSDGAIDTEVKALKFTAPGTKPVSTEWTLGGPELPHYVGWEAIKVLSPNVLESPHCDFDVTCNPPAPRQHCGGAPPCTSALDQGGRVRLLPGRP